MTGKSVTVVTVFALVCVGGGTITRAQTDSGVQQSTASALPASAIESIAPSAEKSKGFLLWMDNSLSMLPYGWNYKVDPSEQTTFTFEHVHESAIGDFFGFVDVTSFQGKNGSGDQTTWYGELSPRLSLSKIFDQKLDFVLFQRSLFEIKDVLLAAQYERGADADVAQAVLAGIGFNLDVRKAGLLGPLGEFKYIQLNLYARSELTANAPNGFRDMQVTLVAAYPIVIGPVRFLIDGYFDWVLGIGPEEWSYHLNPQIKLDVGNFFGKPDKIYAGVELDFWWNKYQIRSTDAFDTDQRAISLLFKYHF